MISSNLKVPVTFVPSAGGFEPVSITEQSDFPVGIYSFPDQCDSVIYFNAGLVLWKGEKYLATRRFSWSETQAAINALVVWKLENNVPVKPRRIVYSKVFNGEEHEDPRAMVFGDYIWISCCNFIQGKTFASQILSRLNVNLEVSKTIHPIYGDNKQNIRVNTGHEKNWCWFDYGNELYCVYKPWPHEVVKFSGATPVHAWKIEESECPWIYGEMRGGTPPVKVDNEYFCFFHSSMPWNGPKRRYVMGAYAFESKPPFRVTRITKEPILIGSFMDYKRENSPLVVFPCGAVIQNDIWHVTGGCNDSSVFWQCIPHDKLLQRMDWV